MALLPCGGKPVVSREGVTAAGPLRDVLDQALEYVVRERYMMMHKRHQYSKRMTS
jgi:hypothetical protein